MCYRNDLARGHLSSPYSPAIVSTTLSESMMRCVATAVWTWMVRKSGIRIVRDLMQR
jgi:hypothetical protein